MIGFNASGPLYYVCLYIQLMIANQILLCVLHKIDECVKVKGKYVCGMFEMILLFVVILISYFTTNYTNVMEVLGGGILFGGTFLVFFYTGMLFAKHNIFRIYFCIICYF